MEKCSNFSKIEGKVPLKRSFQFTGNENMVPVSESPTYPGSHLSRVYCIDINIDMEIVEKEKNEWMRKMYLCYFSEIWNFKIG